MGEEAKMPLVISHKAKRTFYIKNEEILGEILGHSNFDGEDWAIGDLIVFEDGTGAVIEKQEQFHVWSYPKPIELCDVLSAIRSYGDPRLMPDENVDSFPKLFVRLSAPLPKKSWWRSILAR